MDGDGVHAVTDLEHRAWPLDSSRHTNDKMHSVSELQNPLNCIFKFQRRTVILNMYVVINY